MKRAMLEGYVTEKREQKTVNGTAVEITTYQGDHQDEYLVREENGRCWLFYKGILQLSWKEVDNKIVGGITVYKNGKALRRQDWIALYNKENRYIKNRKSELELVIEGNGVIYRGGYDSAESMKREGRGVECDEKSGRILRYGVWKDDELFQVIQEFESEEVMIEYDTEEGEENASVLNRHPVYEGGYVFDEATSSYLRHGEGCEIDVNTGCATREGKWERGTLVESVELFDGWYVKMDGSDVFDWGVKMEIHNWDEWQNVDKRVTDLVIPSNHCNESRWRVLDMSGLKYLKRLEIGGDCFKYVKEVKLIGLHALEKVVIGKNSFTEIIDENKLRHFHLKDCEQLKELKIGCNSFVDYSVCEIANLPSLEVIKMGEVNTRSCNFMYASLELKSDGDGMK